MSKNIPLYILDQDDKKQDIIFYKYMKLICFIVINLSSFMPVAYAVFGVEGGCQIDPIQELQTTEIAWFK